MLDLERIIQTGIPDIAPVYGGVRGRTISSHKQAYAWKTVVAAGLRQVIDLRKDYSVDRYPELCRQYGVDYFHYPIDNDRETIAKMVELFPTFCVIGSGVLFVRLSQACPPTFCLDSP